MVGVNHGWLSSEVDVDHLTTPRCGDGAMLGLADWERPGIAGVVCSAFSSSTSAADAYAYGTAEALAAANLRRDPTADPGGDWHLGHTFAIADGLQRYAARQAYVDGVNDTVRRIRAVRLPAGV